MIRATVTTQKKDYVDRGVQTDLVRRLSRPHSSTSKPVNPRIYDDPAPTTPPGPLNIGRSFHLAAYTHSPSGGSPLASGPARSPHNFRKHPQLPYSRPSQIHGITQRVLSLPETSPPRVTVVRETRGVSLSERPRVSLSSSDNTGEFSASAETSFLSENRSGSSRTRRSFPSCDMPRTPSPPSSPESVMIIGNDMRVPIAFLRQKGKADHVYEDESGWISWASSPPKPIPALHGPLSLPYARCPSGAEGTIIEGEDLSRKIWGLGIEDPSGHPVHSRNGTPHVSFKPAPRPSCPQRIQAQRRSLHNTVFHQQHNSLHWPQPQTPHDHFHPSPVDSPTHEARSQILLHQRALESLGARHSSRVQAVDHTLNVPHISDSWNDVYDPRIDMLEPFQGRVCAYEGQKGLGFDWQETLRPQHDISTEPVRNKSPISLKPSAPVFVPASQQVTQQYPRIFVESRMPHTVNPSQRFTAFEIAQQSRVQQRPQDFLPTPPGSSSPQWTPCLPQYTDPFPPLNIHSLVPVKNQPSFDQQSYSPQFLQDPSQELRRFVFEQMRSPDMDVNVDFIDNAAAMHQNQPITPRMFASTSHYRKPPPIDMSPPHPGPPPNSPLPPIPSPYLNRLHSFAAVPSSPTSPDPRVQSRNPSRLPRSVPFARLLQRRLSSVPEEESGHYMEAYTPPPSPLKASTATRPPRPPSSSQADSFQLRSYSSISQYHGGMTSPHSGFTSQTMQVGELDSDEARWVTPNSGRAKATVKLPLRTANTDMPESQGECSLKIEGSENAREKESGKPRKKVRSKKNKGGSIGRTTAPTIDNVSPWLAASLGVET
ncbi:hypothetical protein GGX14DRAFT_357273 [Mycena pura]|uniref:Uncharacterized protein n=1 Tax=Mycena pura TaxID=153505 RepID=A0AAD6VP80_9AGAR|nr:hypothetical protein GGX14DRAFT_357273 [Mycena pura]